MENGNNANEDLINGGFNNLRVFKKIKIPVGNLLSII